MMDDGVVAEVGVDGTEMAVGGGFNEGTVCRDVGRGRNNSAKKGECYH